MVFLGRLLASFVFEMIISRFAQMWMGLEMGSQVACDEEHKIPWEIAWRVAVVRDNTVYRQQTPSTLSLGWGCFFSAS
jgi:hypothetical protein